MITEEAARRLEALKFWDKHGLGAALDFYRVSRRILFNWKRQYRESDGNAGSLNAQSRAPKRRRTRQRPAAVLNRLGELRKRHPGLGAEKLQLFLADWCEPRNLSAPSVRTVIRLVAERPEFKKAKPSKARTNRRKAAHDRKPKGFKAAHPGQCVGVDTIEIQRDGLKSYISPSPIFTAALPWR